jgi:hypothetical protein
MRRWWTSCSKASPDRQGKPRSARRIVVISSIADEHGRFGDDKG